MHNCLFFSRVPSKSYLNDWEYYNVDLRIIRSFSFSNVYPEISYFPALTRILIGLVVPSKRIHLVYLWWWHTSFPLIFLCWLLKIPTISTGAIHMFDIGGGPDFYNNNFLFRLFSLLGLRLSSHNHLISKDQFNSIARRFKLQNASLIYPCISKSDFRSLPLHKDSSIVFSTISWMNKISFDRKGVTLMIEALSLLPHDLLNRVRYNIVGRYDGSDFSEIEKLIPDSLKDVIHLHTNLPYQEKYCLLSKTHFACFVSSHEGFGNAVLESMSIGTPCIVSRYTAQPELVDFSNGFIVLENTPEKVCSVLSLIISDFSNDSYSKLRLNAYNKSKLFSFEQRELQLHQIFTRFLTYRVKS